jgi:type IV pilus assembly protein PilC
MAYPVIILVAMVGVVIYMLQTIIPQVAQIFTDMGGKLPAATQFLMNLSYAIKHYGVIMAVVLVGIAFGARALVHNNPTIRYWWHFIILKIPLSIGKLAKQINTVRFTRTLGSLLTSGVTVLEALEITADTVPNDVFKKEIRAAAEKVKNGSTLAEPIKGSRVVFDPIVAQMISVGEETGSLDKILLKVTTFYEREVENKVNNLETLIQPLLMMLIGAGVGFIIISVVQPIYSISNLF